MKSALTHGVTTIIYSLFLVLIYKFEISVMFGYMGFSPLGSTFKIGGVITLAVIFSFLLSHDKNVLNLMRIMIHYAFFVPGLIISVTHNASIYYFFVLILAYSCVLLVSVIPLHSVVLVDVSKRLFFLITVLIVLITVGSLVMFGGMRTFNLNLLDVYEFRRIASDDVPTLFGYIFSGVSKVVAPMAMVLAIYYRSFTVTFLLAIMVTFLFGMTHHKSVLVLPFAVAAIYYFFQSRRAVFFMLFGFFVILIMSALEVALRYMLESQVPALFTSMIVRRVFFVPSLLDSVYVEYFLDAPKIFWSTSKLTFGIVSNPYELTAPFLIGRDVFSSESMSANAGFIGSGFSHAGVLGVVIYSTIIGLIIAFLQGFGKVIGHELVFAVSVSIIMTIVTSADLTTAILTHGLLLLFVLLLVFPRKRKIEQSNP